MRVSVFLLASISCAFSLAAPPSPREAQATDETLPAVPPPARMLRQWSEALTLIRTHSAELGRARARVDQQRGLVRSAWAGVLPSLQGTSAGVHQLVTKTMPLGRLDAAGNPTIILLEQPTKNYAQVALVASWPLLSAPAIFQIGTASRQEDSARLAEEDARRVVLTNAAQAILSVVTAERVSELNRNGVQSARDRLSLVRRRAEMGAASGLDVLRVEQDVEAARATWVTGDEQLRQTREALGLALGLEVPVGVDDALRIEDLETAAAAVCTDGSLEMRPDIAAATLDEVIAHRAVTAVGLQWLPTLSAQSQVATTSLEQPTLPNTTWNVQAMVAWSFWDGGARYGAKASALALEASSRVTRELVTRQATIQVAQAQRAVGVAETSLQVATKSRDLAAELEALTTRGLEEGRGSSLEIVTAAAARRQAEISLAVREFDVARARLGARLARAVCNY